MNNFNVSLNKSFKNYLKLKSYCEITQEMVNDYNQMKIEYNNITKDYIQKITQLSSNYSKIISHYKSILQFSNGLLNDLLQLLERIKSIILSQAAKFQTFINGCEAEEEKNKMNPEQLNSFEKTSNEFLLKEKKMTKIYSDLENSYKNLYHSYNLIENALAINIISKQNKISVIDILNQECKNIFEKEKIVIKAKNDISDPKKEYFAIYDEFIKEAKELSISNINTLKSNINCFISSYANYYKTCSHDIENTVKDIVKNEIKANSSEIFDSIISNFVRDININNYKIKVINNKYIENKNKKLILEKLVKKGYLIENDKIFLTDENIYEIVKIMYAQFQFIDEKSYNLTEEQIKINVKKLTNKLLYFGNKKLKLFELGNQDPINTDELNLLFKYLDKSFNRLQFLKVLNLFRAKGIYEIPEKEFAILIKIFILIADKIKSDNDFSCIHLLLILSQTFYCKKDGKEGYIQKYLKNHEIFSNLEIWKKYMNDSIENELNRADKAEKNDNIKLNEENIKKKIINILSTQLIPFCDNMIDFGMSVENIYKIIDPIMDKYQIKDNLKNVLDDLIKSKQNKTE